MPSNLNNQNQKKERAQKVASEVKKITDFLKRHKIVKTQKEIAAAIGRDPSALSKAITQAEEMLPTAEKIHDELLKYYNLVIFDGAVLMNENEDPKTLIERRGDIKIDSHLIGNYELQWKKVN